MPPPGITPVDYLLKENEGYTAMEDSLESIYLVGSIVIDELLSNWDKYEKQLPK